MDDTAARGIKGYLGSAIVPQGVAVFARSTYPAMKARTALKVTWDESGAHRTGTKAIEADYVQRAATPGTVAQSRGDALGRLAAGGTQVIEQTFVFPYLAHAPMEPLDAVVQFDGTTAQAHFGSQGPTIDQGAIAAVARHQARECPHRCRAGGR